tara:strand:+ start:9651 stop:9869 length:219 start_codon:yes stop_codon:yes gene_type:complete
MKSNLEILDQEIESLTETIREAEDGMASLAGQVMRMNVVRDALLTKAELERDDQHPELPFGDLTVVHEGPAG